MAEQIQQALTGLSPLALTLIAGIVALIAGYIVAIVISRLVGKGLKKSTLDKRVASALADGSVDEVKVERYITWGVFYLVMLFAIVGVLQILGLTFVTEPLNQLLNQVFAFIPQLVAAGILLLVAWVLASLMRLTTRKALIAAKVDKRLASEVYEGAEQMQPSSSMLVSTTVANAVYYLIFLLFIPAILGVLNLQGLLEPVQSMLDKALAFLPNLLAAGLIMLVGWYMARLIRRVVLNLLVATRIDNLGQRVGLSGILGGQRLSDVLGTVAYTLVLIPVLIGTINALGIDAITRPASEMLIVILAAIPKMFAASLVLVIAYVVGKLAATLISNLLSSFGFNALLERMGLVKEHEAKQGSSLTPATIVGNVILVGIMFFATMEAANLLEFAAFSALISEFLVFASKMLFGLIVFGVGLYLAGLANRTILAAGVAQARLLAVSARIAIIGLSGAMALRQMGIADSIINLSFGLIVGAVAVAAAIAFGWGGRDFAKKQIEGFAATATNGQPVTKHKAKVTI